MNNVRTNKRRLGVIVGMCAGLALGAVASDAEAATTLGVTVTQVTLGSNFGLILVTSNGSYVAKTDLASPCTSYNRSADLVKSWYSVGQAALLSGKRLNITYTACGGLNQMEIVTLVN